MLSLTCNLAHVVVTAVDFCSHWTHDGIPAERRVSKYMIPNKSKLDAGLTNTSKHNQRAQKQ